MPHGARLGSRRQAAKRTAVSKCNWDLGEKEIPRRLILRKGKLGQGRDWGQGKQQQELCRRAVRRTGPSGLAEGLLGSKGGTCSQHLFKSAPLPSPPPTHSAWGPEDSCCLLLSGCVHLLQGPLYVPPPLHPGLCLSPYPPPMFVSPPHASPTKALKAIC